MFRVVNLIITVLSLAFIGGCSQAPKCNDSSSNICIDEKTPISVLEKFNGVKVVDGNIELVNSSLVNLAPLSELERVTGNFVIHSNDALRSLSGLDKLSVVEGEFTILNNTKLTSIEALKRLEAAEVFAIEDSPNLSDLSALSKLSEVIYLSFHGLESVQSLAGVEHVKYSNLSLSRNHSLSVISGFNNATENAEIYIHQNDNLVEIALFSETHAPVNLSNVSISSHLNLTSISLFNVAEINRLRFSNNAKQTELFGSNSLLNTQVNIVEISESPLITSLTNIENVDGINQIHLNNNPMLDSLTGLTQIESLDALSLVNNPELQSVDDMTQLHHISTLTLIGWHDLEDLSLLSGININNLVIQEADSLVSLEGFDSHQLMSLTLFSLPSLRDVNALASAEQLSQLSFNNAPYITSLSALPPIKEMDSINLHEMDGLSNLSGFESLQTAHTINIVGNHNLNSLAQLSSLSEVTELSIHHNALLEGLGLENLSVIYGLAIHDNPELCNSLAAPLAEKAQYIRTDISSNKDC